MVGRPAMNARLIGGAVEKAAATANYGAMALSLNASTVSCYCDVAGERGVFCGLRRNGWKAKNRHVPHQTTRVGHLICVMVEFTTIECRQPASSSQN